MCVISLFLRMTRRSSIEDLLSANFRRDIRNSRDLKRPIDSEPCVLLDDTLAGTFKRHMLAAKKREEIFTKDDGSYLPTLSCKSIFEIMRIKE